MNKSKVGHYGEVFGAVLCVALLLTVLGKAMRNLLEILMLMAD